MFDRVCVLRTHIHLPLPVCEMKRVSFCACECTLSVCVCVGVGVLRERWGAGVETQKNVRGEVGGCGRVPFNEPYAPSLSTIYDGA